VLPILHTVLDLVRQGLAVPTAVLVLGGSAGDHVRHLTSGVPVEPEHLDALYHQVRAAGAMGGKVERTEVDEERWMVGVPLRCAGGAVVGVLGVVAPPGRPWSEADQVLLQHYRAVVEDRLRADAALRETEGRWRRLVEQNPAPIIISIEGVIRYINPAGARMLGADDAGVLVGAWLGEFVDERQLDDMARRIAALDAGDPLTPREYDIIRRDGARRRVEAFSVPIRYDGQQAAQTVWRDVTERRAHEQALIQAKERVEEMDRLKTTFLMNMSHEVRTPLTTILGFSEVLTEEGDADERELAHYIQDSGERLMLTLNTLLDLAQIESRSVTLAAERIDVVEQVLRVVYLFKRKAQKRGIALRLSVPSEHPVYARLDPMAFRRVLTNLLSNGVKFTHEGSVTLTIDPRGADLHLHVEDTGIGIDRAFLDRSFEAFEQESRGVARSYEGAGIGLTVTKRLVDLMGGTVQVRSEKGTGSRFSLCFPDVMMLDAEGADGPGDDA
jgi:PAS domain S-box-containing protein